MIPVKCPKCGETLTMFHNVSTTLEEGTCPGCGASLVSYDPNNNVDWDALRLQYAGLAMQALISSYPLYGLNPEVIKRVSRRAVIAADSLIEALQNENSDE